jgi:hypothetical protein
MAKKMNMHGNSEREGKAWGRGEHANMPKEVKMQAYPKAYEYGPSDLDDTMTEIDRVNGSAHSKSRARMSNQH